MRAALRKQKKLRGYMAKLKIPNYPFKAKEYAEMQRLLKRFVESD